MIKIIIKKLGIVLITFLLSGCNSDFHFDVFSSDFFLKDNVTTPAEMAVEISSCTSDSLEETKTEILSMFSRTSNAKVVGCETEGMNSMLLVSVDAEIASETSNFDLMIFRNILPDLELDGKTYEVSSVRPMISMDFLKRVETVMENNMQSLSYDKVSLTMTLNNDEREDIIISGYNLWVNGEPMESFRRQKLARRQKLDFKFSNVFSDLVLNGNGPIAFYVGKQK